MKRTVMFYLRFFLMVGLLLAGAVLGADLVNYTYFPSEDVLDFVFIFGSEPTKYATQALDYGRYYEITLPGSLKDVEINRFLGYSPIVGFRASSGKGVITLRFDMLLPREPEIVVIANTLRVTFHRTTVAWDEVTIYSDSAQSGSRPPLTSLLARLQKYLDVNLVIDEASIRGLQAEFVMLSESLKAEDYFFQIMMNNPSLGYAFLPNNTVYVVRKDLISEKVQEVLKEVNLSPKTDTSYWASYNFNLKKDSELFQNFSYFQDTARQQVFNKDAFTQFLIYEFGEKYAKLPSSLQNDLIVLIRGKSGPEEVSIGILLYGNPRLQEKFEYFMGFFEGMGQAGAETETAETITEYSQKIEYAPLSTDELRAFMTFYTKTVKDIFSPNESFPRLDTMRFEIRDANATVYIYGEEPQVKKLAQYLSDYIKDRKARGNEKMERFMVKDGAGMIFALALNRTFPKALVNFEGMSAQTQLAGKPTFEWTDKDLEELRKLQQIYDGEPDEITILGSNYEVITAKRIADDWGILVPPLESEIRMIVLSENLPDNARTALLNPDSPNSLVAKYPSVQIDPSFEPLIILRGKPQDLDTIAGYLTTLEQVWFKKPEYVEVVNVSQELMAKEADKFMTTQVKITESAGSASAQGSSATATETQSPATPSATGSTSAGKTSYIELGQVNVVASNLLSGQGDIATYLAKRWPSVNVSAVYFLDLFILRGENAADIKAAAEELRRLDWEAANETIYSELAYFEYLKAPNISLIWEQFYMKHNVKIIYIESLGAYKFYGPEKYVRAFVDELSEIDVGRIVGQPVVQTELVKIYITSLSTQDVNRLVTTKVPGVIIEAFEGGGYLITGTEEQIAKAKDLLNSMSTDFMEESAILQLSPGVSVETVSKVLALYYDIGKTIQLLDFGGTRILVKGQKERVDNIRLILRSFGLIEEKEGTERSFVKTINVKEMRSQDSRYTPSEIAEITSKLYPTITLELFELSETFMLTGPKEEVEAAENKILELVKMGQETIERNIELGFLFDQIEWKEIAPEDLTETLKKSYPTLVVEYKSSEKALFIKGMKDDVDEAFNVVRSYFFTPSAIIREDQTDVFDLKAKDKNLIELTKEIARSLVPEVKLFLPDESATHTVTLTLSNLNWEKWISIIERLYDYQVELIDGLVEPIYVVTPPTLEHETGLTKTRVLNISHGFDEAARLISSPMFGGLVYTDEVNGAVLFTNIADKKMEQLRPMLEKIVQPKKMVEIKAAVVGSSLVDRLLKELEMTINASSMMSLGSGGFHFTGSLLDFANTTKLLTALTKELAVELEISGRRTESDRVDVVNRRIMALSGKSASIQIGTENTIITVTTSTDASGTTDTRQSQSKVFAGYEFNVTPIVRNDGSIHLEFTVSDGSQEDEQTSDNFKTYKVMKTVANSTVVLKNGETLIIGGLNLKTDSVEVSKIPFFGDLPFVGQFFRLEKKNNENRVVDILITTTIIDVDIPQENIFGLNTI